MPVGKKSSTYGWKKKTSNDRVMSGSPTDNRQNQRRLSKWIKIVWHIVMLEDGLGNVIDFENITIDELYVTLCAQFYEMNRTK